MAEHDDTARTGLMHVMENTGEDPHPAWQRQRLAAMAAIREGYRGIRTVEEEEAADRAGLGAHKEREARLYHRILETPPRTLAGCATVVELLAEAIDHGCTGWRERQALLHTLAAIRHHTMVEM